MIAWRRVWGAVLLAPLTFWVRLTVLPCLLLSIAGTAPAVSLAAGSPTPTAQLTPTPTAMPTASPTPTLTPTLTPTATATAKPASEAARPTTMPSPTVAPTATAGATRDGHALRHHHRRHSLASTVTPVPTATVQHRRRHHRHAALATATSTPGPTPTATPDFNLQVSNSIAPVTCNGPSRPNATAPFLTPPYHGWTSIVSYLDHDLPDYYQDGLVITATGLEARPDAAHHASDFPAYWNPQLRQYLYYDGHNGYDYDISYVPVYAAAPGTVIYAAPEYSYALNHGYGNMVMIDHHNGYITLYGHFSKFLVHAGEHVRRGQQIGISGNTGHSSGPHLHFTVFHNCSPTDPYGWTGGGSDPLAAYQGESSTYLWERAPLVTNPVAGWPGIASLPGYLGYRLLLLRLPGTQHGIAAFTRALRSEARRVRRALGAGAVASVDLLRGAIVLYSPVPPAQIYRIPGIVSIGSPDAALDARTDLLSAVARATLVTRRPTIALGHNRSWHGLLLHWDGRTLLVGQGQKGDALDLRLSRAHPAITSILANPTNGQYAVDLGKLSPHQASRLQRRLENSKPHVRRVPTVAPIRPHVPARRAASASGPPLGLGIGLITLLGAVAAAEALRRQNWLRRS